MNKNTKLTMRIMLTGLAITAGIAAQASTGSQGEGKMKHERPAFSTLDTDGNGELSREEMTAHGKARFEARDTDGDGFLSKDEMMQAGKERAGKRAEKMLKRADANGDGKISFEEMTSGKRGERQAKMFERADTDGNGTISQAEFDEMPKHGHGKRWGKKHSE